MSLVLSELPYAIDALAEHGMSKETMEYHHDIHHKAYVDNGNNLLKGTEWENKSLEDIINNREVYKTWKLYLSKITHNYKKNKAGININYKIDIML